MILQLVLIQNLMKSEDELQAFTLYHKLMRYSQRQREHCCHVMPKDSNLVSFEIIALVICGNDSNRLHSKKMQTWCDHYQRSYHTKETYWKLHGKLLDWVPNRKKKKKRTYSSNRYRFTIYVCSIFKSPNESSLQLSCWRTSNRDFTHGPIWQ